MHDDDDADGLSASRMLDEALAEAERVARYSEELAEAERVARYSEELADDADDADEADNDFPRFEILEPTRRPRGRDSDLDVGADPDEVIGRI